MPEGGAGSAPEGGAGAAPEGGAGGGAGAAQESEDLTLEALVAAWGAVRGIVVAAPHVWLPVVARALAHPRAPPFLAELLEGALGALGPTLGERAFVAAVLAASERLRRCDEASRG